MQSNQSNLYMKTKIMTASPSELRLMLYDGAIKFCHQANRALDKKDYEASYGALMRAQKIVLELSTSLQHEVAPALCQRLSTLYTSIYRLLVDANGNRLDKPVDQAIQLLEHEKDTWQLLMQRAAEGNGQAAENAADVINAQQTAISSLS